jgi:subtilisin family serine protease
MRKMKYTGAALVAVMIFAACKKDTGTSSSSMPNDCVVTNSASEGAVIEGQYIVTYKPAVVNGVAATNKADAVNIGLLQKNNISTSAIRQYFDGDTPGFVAKLSAIEAARLKKDERIVAMEQDRIISLSICFTVAAPTLITWNVNQVGYGDGSGKTAWVIDTGIDFTHPDLSVDQTRSRSFISGQTSASDENGHGTHVAGVIAAKNNLVGVLGVASGANLVSLRVLDKDGKGNLSSIIKALSYVNANAKAGDVVNMSLGADSISNILDQQIENIASKGILFAIAAGNDGKPSVNYSPARATGANIFTVSAVDSLGNFARFSNYGNDIAAPGVQILSTYLNGKYAFMSGTSMATPHVAGLLLLDGNNIHSSGTARRDPDGNPDPIAHK